MYWVPLGSIVSSLTWRYESPVCQPEAFWRPCNPTCASNRGPASAPYIRPARITPSSTSDSTSVSAVAELTTTTFFRTGTGHPRRAKESLAKINGNSRSQLQTISDAGRSRLAKMAVRVSSSSSSGSNKPLSTNASISNPCVALAAFNASAVSWGPASPSKKSRPGKEHPKCHRRSQLKPHSRCYSPPTASLQRSPLNQSSHLQ